MTGDLNGISQHNIKDCSSDVTLELYTRNLIQHTTSISIMSYHHYPRAVLFLKSHRWGTDLRCNLLCNETWLINGVTHRKVSLLCTIQKKHSNSKRLQTKLCSCLKLRRRYSHPDAGASHELQGQEGNTKQHVSSPACLYLPFLSFSPFSQHPNSGRFLECLNKQNKKIASSGFKTSFSTKTINIF